MVFYNHQTKKLLFRFSVLVLIILFLLLVSLRQEQLQLLVLVETHHNFRQVFSLHHLLLHPQYFRLLYHLENLIHTMLHFLYGLDFYQSLLFWRPFVYQSSYQCSLLLEIHLRKSNRLV